MNIDVFLTCRTGSTRLPNKAMLPILGQPAISRLIERIKRAKKVRRIILCTTTLPADDVLEELASSHGLATFRGSVEDVLARYLGAAEKFDTDFIITVDGDDLFCDPMFIDKMARQAAGGKYDFIQYKGLPYGTYPYGMKTSALRKVCEIKGEEDTSGWGKYFTKTGCRPSKTIEVLSARLRHPEYRLTLDYEQDFKLAEEIYARLYPKNPAFGVGEVFDLLAREPALVKINAAQVGVYSRHFKKYSRLKLKRTGQ
ncbi:MAG: NTP transferase domain-containing protein [Candidatus Marsarchaeota archaeon]|nr:NTP transferase domain-containing protein [Candidatus Marsarchaeota archaeon]